MKTSKAQKAREYMLANPEAKPAEVARKFKIAPTYVYVLRAQMKKDNVRAKKYPGVDIDAVHKKDVPQVTHYKLDAKLPIVMLDKPHDPVNNPEHYTDGGVETIDFIEAKGLGYHLGNVVKYISRAGKKGTNNGLEDLRKAQWYLARAIEKNEHAPSTR